MSTPAPRTPSNSVASRKPAKKLFSGDDFMLISHATTKSSNIYWWRGGKFSRQVFQWKMLPRPLASKGGRQGGRRKIPNIIYSDSSEFAKRSKHVAWQAAVEVSQSVTQIIYQLQIQGLSHASAQIEEEVATTELKICSQYFFKTAFQLSLFRKKLAKRNSAELGQMVDSGYKAIWKHTHALDFYMRSDGSAWCPKQNKRTSPICGCNTVTA